MKSLLINSVCGIRSTGRICTDLADKLSMQGYECKIAYGREKVPERFQKYAIRIGTDFDVRSHALTARLFDSSGFCSQHATKKFLKWANTYNPDLLWLHNIHGYYLNIEMLFNWIKSRPNMEVKWTLHDCWPFTGHCSYFTYVKCEKWKSGCYKCPQLHAYPASYLLDCSKKNYNTKKDLFSNVINMSIITPSQWLADLVKESYLREYPIMVWHNTINTSIFRPTRSDFREKYNLVNKKIILGIASVWDKRKGLDDFFKLSKKLDNSYSIILIGLSEKQIKNLPANIIGLSRINNPIELAEIYTTADVFFNPTYEDNYPTVNLEAESCNTKVYTYDVGGSKETIHRSDSIIFNVGDLDSVINCLISGGNA